MKDVLNISTVSTCMCGEYNQFDDLLHPSAKDCYIITHIT